MLCHRPLRRRHQFLPRCPRSRSRAESAKQRVRLVGRRARRMKPAVLPPANLVFLIDVSGSMEMPNKLPLVKHSPALLVNQLRAQDRVAIVVYAGNAGLVLPSTGGDNKGAILSAIDGLEAGGS